MDVKDAHSGNIKENGQNFKTTRVKSTTFMVISFVQIVIKIFTSVRQVTHFTNECF
jgi:hypothetical protein